MLTMKGKIELEMVKSQIAVIKKVSFYHFCFSNTNPICPILAYKDKFNFINFSDEANCYVLTFSGVSR